MRRTTAVVTLAVALLALPAATRPVVRITEPPSDEILYAETRVVALPGADSVAHLLFYLDDFASPICRADGPPWDCRFDAGVRFTGRTIRVDALDRDGRLVGSDALRTADATEPVRVTSHSITVPVVATGRASEALELAAEDLRCLYGAEACEVFAARKIAEEKDTGGRVHTSIEILVDTSSSIRAFRQEIEAAATLIIDGAPAGTRVQLAEMAHVRRIAVPFTDSKEALRAGIDTLGQAGDMSCIFSAMQAGAAQLATQSGNRALFVISDGLDTCDPGRGLDPHWSRSYSGLDTVLAFQRLKVPLYLYRLAAPGMYRKAPSFAIYKNLALVTGGRIFDQGSLVGGGGLVGTGSSLTIEQAAGEVVTDLRATYLVDVGLPDGTKEGTKRRLDLRHVDPEIRLRHQEYWEARSRKDELVRLLYADLTAARERAATQLATIADVGTAADLLAAIQVEPSPHVRKEKLTALHACLISGLLHGDAEEQKTAVQVAEQLVEAVPRAFDGLLPVARVYLKTPASDRLKKRIRSLAEGYSR